VCLESTQIDSYLNLSEDQETKSYHQVSIVVVVVVAGLAIALVVPCVHHLMVW
jgi:hypothetical protein